MGTLSLWTISPRPEYGPAARKKHTHTHKKKEVVFSEGTTKRFIKQLSVSPGH